MNSINSNTQSFIQRILNLAQIGTWSVDVKTNICNWSKMVYEIHEEEQGKIIRVEDGINYYHPDHIPLIQDAVNMGIEKKLPWDLELKIITAKGNEKWVRAIGEAIQDEEGKTIKLNGLFQDIHLKKMGELQSVSMNKRLAKMVDKRTHDLIEINNELESFTYSVSHDLQAPLRAIKNYATILKNDFAEEFSPTSQKFLNRIISNSLAMNQLIKDLLSWSHMRNHCPDLTLVDPAVILENIISSNHSQSQKIINVKKLDKVFADAKMLKQVFANLISNAIKYSSKKDEPYIEIGSTNENGDIIYYVKDNGVGFDMKQYHRIFQVFQRLHNDKEFAGTGIGLAICQKIMKIHNGKIWAESSKGVGSTFFIQFPSKNISS